MRIVQRSITGERFVGDSQMSHLRDGEETPRWISLRVASPCDLVPAKRFLPLAAVPVTVRFDLAVVSVVVELDHPLVLDCVANGGGHSCFTYRYERANW